MKRISRSMPIIAMVAMTLAFASCSKAPPPIVATAKESPFEDAVGLGEVVPLASGGAYLVSMSNVYYVFGEKAVAVSGLAAGRFFYEVEPLADGTAILKSRFGNPPTLYLLRGSKAFAISETTEQLTGPVISSNQGFLFATNQRLRRALKVAGIQATGAETEIGSNYDPE